MKTILILIVLTVFVYIAFEAIRVRGLITMSSRLVTDAERYERTPETGRPRILVVGDSTGAGVGADAPEHSVPGRIARLLDATVENRAVSGAVVREIALQFAEAREVRYDLILIQGGANDIIQLYPLGETVTEMQALLEAAQKKSDRVILITAGKVGDAPLFPRVVAPYFTHRAALLRTEFMRISAETGAHYVDLFSAADVFKSDPTHFYAADFFHPSGNGYEVWAREASQIIVKEWPDLVHAE